MNDSVLIVGTGAMACLFASRLTAGGVQVTLLGTWKEGLRALRTHGVCLVREDGSEQDHPVRATSDPADCADARWALVMVKSWQTQRVAQQLSACLAPDGLALTLQNGLGNRETLVKSLGKQRVTLGVTTMGATLLAPGRVRAGGEGTISLGAHARLDTLAVVLQRAGFVVEIVPQADDLLWSKLVINAAINPLSALMRVPNGVLLSRPSARALLADAAREAAAVASAHGQRLTYADAVAKAEDVARRTAANHSSMYQDVQRGAPTEIDAICGAVVATAEKHGVPSPVNRTLWRLIRALDEKGK